MMNQSFEKLQWQLESYKGYQLTYWETIYSLLRHQRFKRNQLITTAQFDVFFIQTRILCLHDSCNDDIIHFMKSPEIVPDTYLDSNYYYQFLEDKRKQAFKTAFPDLPSRIPKYTHRRLSCNVA